MEVRPLQAIISIVVVSIILIVAAIIALAPVIGGYPTEKFTEHLKLWGSLHSGLVGLIVGYYFHKRGD